MIPGKRNIPPIHWRHIRSRGNLIDFNLIFDDYPNRLVSFDYETYLSSEIVCEYVITNCNTGQAEYLTERKDAERMFSICRASCSVPYFTPTVKLDGVPYLDGGLADPVPIRWAVSREYEKNIVILTREKGYRKKYSKAAYVLDRKLYSRYPRLVETMENRSARYNETCGYLD